MVSQARTLRHRGSELSRTHTGSKWQERNVSSGPLALNHDTFLSQLRKAGNIPISESSSEDAVATHFVLT